MKVTSDVIRDLIPLVKDGVASEDSVKLVYAYLEQDEQLKHEFDQYEEFSFENKELSLPPARDIRIINAMKRSIMLTQLMILVAGTVIGVAITDSFEMLYNFLLMPFVGALAVFSFRSKWKYSFPLVIFVIAYGWKFAKVFIEEGDVMYAFNDAIFYSSVYSVLAGIGLAIGALLQFAFGKETEL